MLLLTMYSFGIPEEKKQTNEIYLYIRFFEIFMTLAFKKVFINILLRKLHM